MCVDMFGICCLLFCRCLGILYWHHKYVAVLYNLFVKIVWVQCALFLLCVVQLWTVNVQAAAGVSLLVDGCASDHRWRLSARGYGSKSAAFSACLTGRHHHHTHSHCCPHHILLHATTTNFPFSLSVTSPTLSLPGQECRPGRLVSTHRVNPKVMVRTLFASRTLSQCEHFQCVVSV